MNEYTPVVDPSTAEEAAEIFSSATDCESELVRGHRDVSDLVV